MAEAIQDERQKYQEYLCSREWGVLKEAVHKRAGGICERCKVFPIDAVHHLTYERKYNERIEDLEAHCQWCHQFTHGKWWFDPAKKHSGLARYIRCCQLKGRNPIPYELQGGLRTPSRLTAGLMLAVDLLRATSDAHYHFTSTRQDPSEEAAIAIDRLLPFEYLSARHFRVFRYEVQEYDYAIQEFSFPSWDCEPCFLQDEDA